MTSRNDLPPGRLELGTFYFSSHQHHHQLSKIFNLWWLRADQYPQPSSPELKALLESKYWESTYFQMYLSQKILIHCQQQAIKEITKSQYCTTGTEKSYTAYCWIWRPSFDFPVPVTLFSKMKCNTPQKTFAIPFLAKMRVSHITSWELIFPHIAAAGLYLLTPWSTRPPTSSLHCRTTSLPWQSRQLTLDQYGYLKLIIGLLHPLLSYPFSHIAILAHLSWLIPW